MYVCVQCERVYDSPVQCLCGGITCPKIIRQKKNRVILHTADQLVSRKLELKKIEGFEFFGGLPASWQLLISGPPGQGKSSFCLRLADSIARQNTNKKILYWSFEEGFSDTLVHKLQLNKIASKNILFCEVSAFAEFLYICDKYKPLCVVIDSLNDASLDTIAIKSVKKRGIEIGMYIAHFTKNDKYKGDSSILHEIDLFVEVRDFTATLKKNRVGHGREEKNMSILEE